MPLSTTVVSENTGRALTDIYESMLKILIANIKDYIEDVANMTLSFELQTDEILFLYENYMLDLCFLFEIVALFLRVRFMKLGVNIRKRCSKKWHLCQFTGTY